MKSKDDMELLAAIRLNDYDAFTALYERYSRSLALYGLQFTDDTDIVKDCLHDIFVSLWTRRAALKIEYSLKSYLLKSVRSAVIQKVKRAKKVYRLDEQNGDDYEFLFTPSPEEIFLKNEQQRQMHERVQKLLSTLTAKQKEVIYLRFYDSLSFDEIASQLNLSVKACYKLMNRAMLQLRLVIPYVLAVLSALFKHP